MNIAFIAHNAKKETLIQLLRQCTNLSSDSKFFATATTGEWIQRMTGLTIEHVFFGPLGGDLQIGAMVAAGQIDVVIFIRDPLTAFPHESDINALLRICDVYDVPVATNAATASILLEKIQQDLSASNEEQPNSGIVIKNSNPIQSNTVHWMHKAKAS